MNDAKSPAARWSAVVTIAVALALGVFAMNPLPIGAFHDDARYLLLARSIAEGTGYRFVLTPGAPAGTHFPPAFPLLLAALWKIAPAFPASETLFKLLNALMLPLAAFATFTFARTRGAIAPWAACAVALAFACSVPVLFLDGVLFSEPLFIASLLGALMLSERSMRGQTHDGDSGSLHGLAFAAGVAIGGVTMIRTLGIALGVGLAITLILRREWRSFAISMAGIALLVVPWQLWTMSHGGEIPPILAGDLGTYGSWVGAALHTEGNGFILRVAAANMKGFSILLELFDVSGVMAAIVAIPLVIAAGIGLRRLAPDRAGECRIARGVPARRSDLARHAGPFPLADVADSAHGGRVRRVGDREMEYRTRTDAGRARCNARRTLCVRVVIPQIQHRHVRLALVGRAGARELQTCDRRIRNGRRASSRPCRLRIRRDGQSLHRPSGDSTASADGGELPPPAHPPRSRGAALCRSSTLTIRAFCSSVAARHCKPQPFSPMPSHPVSGSTASRRRAFCCTFP